MRYKFIVQLFGFSFFGLVCVNSLYSQELHWNEKEVWDQELKYYEYSKSNEPAKHNSLFHENIIGWPTTDSIPKGKNKVSLWIPLVHENPKEEWNYELDLQAIQSFGNVVIVHYKLHEWFISKETGEELSAATYRISHTWLKEGGKWKIISGMGGKLN